MIFAGINHHVFNIDFVNDEDHAHVIGVDRDTDTGGLDDGDIASCR